MSVWLSQNVDGSGPGVLFVPREVPSDSSLSTKNTDEPVHLLFSVDASASMKSQISGTNLNRFEMVTQQVVNVISDRIELGNEGDRCSIIAFDDTCAVIAQEEKLDRSLQIFQAGLVDGSILRKGFTNISLAHEKVYEILLESKQTSRVFEFFLTDGLANRGKTEPSDIARSKAQQYAVLKSKSVRPLLFYYAISSGSNPAAGNLVQALLGGDVCSSRHIKDDEFDELAGEFGTFLSMMQATREVVFDVENMKIYKNLHISLPSMVYFPAKPKQAKTTIVHPAFSLLQKMAIWGDLEILDEKQAEEVREFLQDFKIDLFVVATGTEKMLNSIGELVDKVARLLENYDDCDMMPEPLGLLRQNTFSEHTVEVAKAYTKRYRDHLNVDTQMQEGRSLVQSPRPAAQVPPNSPCDELPPSIIPLQRS